MNTVNEFINRNLLGVNVTDSYDNTLLSVAAQYGCYNICDLLIKNGASVKTQNKELNTPLHYANAFGHRKIVNLLMENDAREDILNKKNKLPWEGIWTISVLSDIQT